MNTAQKLRKNPLNGMCQKHTSDMSHPLQLRDLKVFLHSVHIVGETMPLYSACHVNWKSDILPLCAHAQSQVKQLAMSVSPSVSRVQAVSVNKNIAQTVTLQLIHTTLTF